MKCTCNTKLLLLTIDTAIDTAIDYCLKVLSSLLFKVMKQLHAQK